jgi:hypothetical protein
MSAARRTLCVLVAALVAGPVGAQVGCGSASEVFAQCPSVGFTFSDAASHVRAADDFSLDTAADVKRIRWWGIYADATGTSPCGAQSDNFSIWIWADSGGNGPDENVLIADLSSLQVPFSGAPMGQMNVGGTLFTVFEYEIDLGTAPLSVPAGVTWWLEVHNDLASSFGCYWRWVIGAGDGNGYYSYTLQAPNQLPWSASTSPSLTPDHDLAFALLGPGVYETYCVAGTSASGCAASISASGTASATASSGFDLLASGVEGAKDGYYFFGSNGRAANAWGNGTSYQCVAPPLSRAGLLTGGGTTALCDGSFSQDLNALWCPTCPRPQKNPGAGVVLQAQLWYRDPQNTSNRPTSLSDAIEFCVAP